ncbi:glycosyltransferase [Runella limosa]|uniref:glycosyltransferase n=1 Tax=Runella limosa TaxID=370978 RepID=UPI001E40B06A|nr:glycosyltransferase [Runella limosa]
MVQSTLQMSGEEREKWIRQNRYYYTCLIQYLRFVIPSNASILEIGCGTGYLLEKLQPSRGVGIDSSKGMIEYARQHRGQHDYFHMDAEALELTETFDYVIISDTIGYFGDVQKVFQEVQKVCTPQTRVIISYTNFFWLPLLRFAEIIGLKMPQKRQNWLDISDIANLLTLANFDVVRQTKKIIFPRYIPLVSWFLNKYVGNLPLFNFFGLVTFLVARSVKKPFKAAEDMTVSVVIPARNEKGNIEALVQRTPKMGKETEIIFVEGNSTDDTWGEIQRICQKYQGQVPLKWIQQEGKGKGDAVRKGYSIATGDVLMILDADMTVPPEDLPKFFEAIATGKGEYINGTRLVYPMEKEAMRTLNLLGNKFFSIAFSWLLGQRLKDTLCGTKVMTRENYLKLAANRSYFGDFDPFGDFDLIFGAAKLNLKFIEVPIRYRARTYGETNISRFKHGWLLLKMTFFALNKIKFL